MARRRLRVRSTIGWQSRPPNRHHIVPRARQGWQGKGEGVVRIDAGYHTAYHSLFGTLVPWEVARFVNELMHGRRARELSTHDLLDMQEEIMRTNTAEVQRGHRTWWDRPTAHGHARVELERLPEKQMDCWEQLFGDPAAGGLLTSSQVVHFVCALMFPGKRTTRKGGDIVRLRDSIREEHQPRGMVLISRDAA